MTIASLEISFSAILDLNILLSTQFGIPCVCDVALKFQTNVKLQFHIFTFLRVLLR